MHGKRWLGESIINILDNSVKYSLDNKIIDVELIDYSSRVEIKIKDNGYGIKKEDKEKIFERFFRSYNKEIIKKEGSGIGLYLSKKIVIDHGGIIKVESEYGIGSRFTIVLYKHLIN